MITVPFAGEDKSGDCALMAVVETSSRRVNAASVQAESLRLVGID
jgi:hypothetical protein